MRHVAPILFFLLCLLTNTLFAQKQITHQSLYWLRYFNTLNFNEKWNWQNELDTRHFFTNNRQQQFIVHSRVMFRPNTSWNFGIGLTGSWQKSQDPLVFPRPKTPELRIVEEVGVNQPLLQNLSANYRIRVEQRFISNHTGPFDEDCSFKFRHRYRFQLTYFWQKANMTFRTSEELFVNAGQQNLFASVDQNRTYVSAEKRFSPALSFEVGYMNINQKIKKLNFHARKDNVRITLYHTLNAHKG